MIMKLLWFKVCYCHSLISSKIVSFLLGQHTLSIFPPLKNLDASLKIVAVSLVDPWVDLALELSHDVHSFEE